MCFFYTYILYVSSYVSLYLYFIIMSLSVFSIIIVESVPSITLPTPSVGRSF